MDKSAIKSFAVSARNKLIQGVTQKAYQIGISEKEIKQVNEIQDGVSIEINNNYIYLTHSENEQREKLIAQIESKGYEQVMEEVAYTWFNRIVAIRFMEVNEYLPTGIRVLSSEDKSKIEPDSVTQVNSIVEDLGLNLDTVYKFQDDNNDDGLFKYILIKQCNALGKIMPVIFEKIQDYTELLLPDNLLVEGNVVSDLVKNVSEEDFKEQVEIIGWLYQYYISEKKDAVFADLKKNKKITKENIPAATQLFTPDWIVKYMVENSLGRLWLEGHPNEELQSSWKYYLEEAKQEAEVEAELERIREESKNLSPEDITVLDPSMGSGHILVYAFDVLYEIYLSAGYSEREIPRLILEKNIYGLDIDDRAGQLAYFALIMKARGYSRRIFRDMVRNPIELNVCSIQESNGITGQDVEYFSNGDNEIKKNLEYLIEVFSDAKEYGSIIYVEQVNFEKLENRLSEIKNEITDLFSKESRSRLVEILPSVINQSKIMSKKYDVCITNPPYMGSSGMNTKLISCLKSNYPKTKGDLSTVFMDASFKMVKKYGYISMINIPSWMFITTYYDFRTWLIDNTNITNMIHLGRGVFGSDFGSVAFTINRSKINNYKGKYRKLFKKNGQIDTIENKKSIFFSEYGNYITSQEKFKVITGNPCVYWLNSEVINIFRNARNFEEYIDITGSQHITANNEKYLKEFWEVNYKEIGTRWISYAKGGKFRRWYGNVSLVVDWSENAKNFYRTNKTSNMLSDKYLFREGITWSASTAGKFSTRVLINKGAFDKKGSSLFALEKENEDLYLAYLNSNVAQYFLNMFSDRHDYQVVDIKRLPFIEPDNKDIINNLVKENKLITQKDWDSFETSWDFKKHPIIKSEYSKIKESFNSWSEFTKKQFSQLKYNEEELNRIFIDIYGLKEELTPEVEDKDITIRKVDRNRDIKSFISYAVGCMLGRYSLDTDGLVFAGGEFDSSKYKTFKVDIDGIIPINDAQYFEDDIVAKFVEFVKLVFGEDTLEENLNYIADTECFKRKANETSRDCLRRYFLKGFMEDHLKIYQKKPIYWMFDSGKQNGFKALIYMHRYDESMVAKIRTDYLHALQRTYEAEISRLENDMSSEALSAKEKANAKKRKDTISKQLVECIAYDQVIAHIANQRVSIDLDDGVKVNYQKFQGAEVPMGDGKKDLKADLLFKVKM